MKKTLKIMGKVLRYFFGSLLIIGSFTSLNVGLPIHFVRALGCGILLFPVFYMTINEKRMYKLKWEVLFPIIWFAIFSVIIYIFNL